MGQYQQWLFAQEVEQRLQGEVETLETELLYLWDRIAILEQSVPERENMILQALLAYGQDQADPDMTQDQATASELAQSDWRGLPRLETPHMQAEEMTAYTPERSSQMDEDMLAFFDQAGQAAAKSPSSAWGPRARMRATERVGEEQLVDEETRRLNENIQRWFVRWHRQITGAEQAEEARNE